jgi:hypothetical protein
MPSGLRVQIPPILPYSYWIVVETGIHGSFKPTAFGHEGSNPSLPTKIKKGGDIMPRGDGTGPDGKGPKSTNKGYPTPKRDGSGGGKGRGGRGRGGRRNGSN